MKTYLVTRQAGQTDSQTLTAVAEAYLTSVLLPTQAGRLGRRGERELRTLAMAIDYLVSGEVAQAADLLMQRFKAVELAAVSDAGWQVAQHLELIPSSEVTATGEDELRSAARFERDVVRYRRTGAPHAGR